MNTPLQQAAQELIDRWDSPMWRYQQATTDVIAELRKALDAELAQSVEPDFYAACAEHNGGWIPLPGYSNETVSGVKSLILESARKEGWKGTIEGRLFSLCWQVMPVYLYPPQPQATTPAVPELLEELENCRDLLKIAFPDAPVDSCIGVGIIKASAAIAAAQGEKP